MNAFGWLGLLFIVLAIVLHTGTSMYRGLHAEGSKEPVTRTMQNWN